MTGDVTSRRAGGPHASDAGGPIRAGALLEALLAEGVTHVVGLPDSALSPIFERVDRHPSVRRIAVTREGEAFAIASGLWLGGKTPLVAVQCTGLLESGDAFRGTAQRMGVPLVVLVTYRGYEKTAAAGLPLGRVPHRPRDLVRPDADSAALYAEPTLKAWGLPYEMIGDEGDEARVGEAFERARGESRPVALLLRRKPG